MKFKVVNHPLLVVYLVFISSGVWAQTEPIQQSANILPPSPTASELGKYGLVPVGFSTGTPNIDIPIGSFSTKSLTVPISLSYNSNGVKVDQIASWVGMGWSLNAGGVITRTIRDEADENNLNYPYPEHFAINDAESMQYLETAGSGSFDSEVDLYAFNFQGYVGKFVFNHEGALVVMPYQNIKIERIIDGINGYFIITTPDGVVYTFVESETSKTSAAGAECGKSYNGSHETSWFLTKIQNPLGDVINLEYVTNTGFTYEAGVSQSIMKKISNTPCASTDCPTFVESSCVNLLSVNGKVLKRIWSTNYGEVEFESTKSRSDVDDYKLDRINVKDASGSLIRSVNFAYTFSTATTFMNGLTTNQLKQRMFLSTLTDKDALNQNVRSHSFIYNDMNGLPPRLSFAQDHWGFFNGKSNTYLVPKNLEAEDANGNKLFANADGDREPNDLVSSKGILTKVIYPTGGSTELQYESNNYWGSYLSYPVKTPVILNVTGSGQQTQVTNSFPLANVVYQEIYISSWATLDPNYTPNNIDPLHHFATLEIWDGQSLQFTRRLDIGESFQDYIDLMVGHTYSVKISANGNIVDAGINFNYYATASQNLTGNIKTGGIRIRKLINYDPVANKSEETNYFYAKISDLTKSSGQIGATPIYYATSTIQQHCGEIPCATYDCFYGALYSNSQNSIYPVGGNHVYYTNVTVTKGSDFANGAEEHEFNIQFDSPGQVVFGEDIHNASFTNFGWSNGLEKAVRVYDFKTGAFVLRKEVVNNYVEDNRYNNSVSSLVVRQNYTSLGCLHDVVITCDASSINKTFRQFICITNHSHLDLIGGFPFGNGETRCVNPGAKNVWVTVGNHPCNGKAIGQIVVMPEAIAHLDAVEYKNIAYWYYMNSSTEKVYDETGANPLTTLTEYFYDNPKHGLLSRNRVTLSNGKTSEMTTWYPQDYGAPGNMQTLKNNSILNVPVKVEKTVAGNLVEGQVVQYSDGGQPKDVYQYESNQLSAPTLHDTVSIVPVNYQLEGSLFYTASNNLKEITSEKSPTVSYLWDYNDTKPVAKAINALSDQIAYTSFESTGKGNWNYTGISYNDIPVKTGKYYYKLGGGSITRTLSPGKYKLQFWSKGTVTIGGGTIVATVASLPDANGWISYEYEVTIVASTTLVISGTATVFIDELRIYPLGAQIETLTYIPNIGVSSTTDTNSVISYYEYDSFGRLKYIKDKDKNILKTFDYHYKESTN